MTVAYANERDQGRSALAEILGQYGEALLPLVELVRELRVTLDGCSMWWGEHVSSGYWSSRLSRSPAGGASGMHGERSVGMAPRKDG